MGSLYFYLFLGSRREVAGLVKQILLEEKQWTERSISLLSPLTIFEYDRLEHNNPPR